jgi:transketolase
MTAMTTTYEDGLLDLCARDERVVVMTSESRSAIRSIPDRLGERFLDVGSCEQTMIGMAAGLSLRGRVPVCHALATFLTLRAYEFIRTDLGIANLHAILVGSLAGFLSGANGPTHQAIEDAAVLRVIPGMRVVWPADVDELVAAMDALVREPGPAYVRYLATPARVAHRPFELGRAEELRPGDEVTLVGAGLLVSELLDAAEALEHAGHSTRVLSLRSLAPLDNDAILAAARTSRLVVTVEDHLAVGGVFGVVAETLVRGRVHARVLPLALERRYFEPLPYERVLANEGFTGEAIARRVLSELEG